MREKKQKQMPLSVPFRRDFDQAKELEAISRILDQHPAIYEEVYQDLSEYGPEVKPTGAEGMSAEQVLRTAIVKTLFGYSYRHLAFHISDSACLRTFCQVGFGKRFKKSTLQKNIKSLSSETWEQINRVIVGHAKEEDVEAGREARIDCTVVESNIHHPTDATLLWDAVRVLTRFLVAAKDLGVRGLAFMNHGRRAKRRMLGIINAKKHEGRKRLYADLIKVAEMVAKDAEEALPLVDAHVPRSLAEMIEQAHIFDGIQHYLPLAGRVIEQTRRRVLHGESVPASEKLVSIFETHTDIIIKDRREIYFGHKICLTGGRSNLILDCVILKGNPADSDLALPMLDRQKDIYGRAPLKAALDGGFASKENVKLAKGAGVKDVCFAKKRGIKVADMCRSEYVYKRLRNFRAGIESGISWLKRCFGLGRCNWHGWSSFKSYVWASVVSANLLTLARARGTA
jgi:IS5 family transposase